MRKHFEIEYLSLTISLTAMEAASLPPFLGSALRGIVGKSLLKADKEACQYLYDNSNHSDTVQIITKPYMVIPPDMNFPQIIFRRGEILSFEIVLFGNAVIYARSLVTAMVKMRRFGLGADRYPFVLSEIMNSCEKRIIWRQESTDISSQGLKPACLICDELRNVKEVMIKMCTPLRIRHGGELVTAVTFQTLIRNITNRIIALTERYGGWVDSDEVERLQLLSTEVETVKEKIWIEQLERYSNRSSCKMDFSGMAGNLEFRGELTPFVPWLYAAERLHVGRNTTFGMGKISVKFW